MVFETVFELVVIFVFESGEFFFSGCVEEYFDIDVFLRASHCF